LNAEIINSFDRLEELTGMVVILDVFRASNTIISLMATGVRELVLLADLEEARRLRDMRSGWVLLGERRGITPPDFDGGNSPVEAATGAFACKRVILTTSAGTQAVGRLGSAKEVMFASFANAAAVVALLKRRAAQKIHFLPMGLEAASPALEDELAAQYLAESLAGDPPDFASIKSRLLNCEGAERLRSLDQHADLVFCTTLDSHRLIPRVINDDFPKVATY
jgi:2-phosphosulfolactate phosphatase